jgi:hypothetical protein
MERPHNLHTMIYDLSAIPPKRRLILQATVAIVPLVILWISFRFPVAHPDPPRLMSLPYQVVFIISMLVFSRMFQWDAPARWIAKTVGYVFGISRRDLVDPSEWLASNTEGFIEKHFPSPPSQTLHTQRRTPQTAPLPETELQRLEKRKRLRKLMEEEDARRKAAQTLATSKN